VEWNDGARGCRAANDDIKAVLRALDAELKKRKCPPRLRHRSLRLTPLYSVADRMSKTYNAKYGNYVTNFRAIRALRERSTTVSPITITAPIF